MVSNNWHFYSVLNDLSQDSIKQCCSLRPLHFALQVRIRRHHPTSKDSVLPSSLTSTVFFSQSFQNESTHFSPCCSLFGFTFCTFYRISSSDDEDDDEDDADDADDDNDNDNDVNDADEVDDDADADLN